MRYGLNKEYNVFQHIWHWIMSKDYRWYCWMERSIRPKK